MVLREKRQFRFVGMSLYTFQLTGNTSKLCNYERVAQFIKQEMKLVGTGGMVMHKVSKGKTRKRINKERKEKRKGPRNRGEEKRQKEGRREERSKYSQKANLSRIHFTNIRK